MLAGVGYGGRAGVADERDFGALLELDNELSGTRDFVVLMVTDEGLVNVEMRQQLQRLAGVFAGDDVNFFEGAQGAQRYVLEIADWG